MVKKVTEITQYEGKKIYALKPVLDVETYPPFERGKKYEDLIPIVVGVFRKNEIIQFYLANDEEINAYKSDIVHFLDSIKEPFLAYYCDFDRRVLNGFLEKNYDFEDIQIQKYESKETAAKKLNIPIGKNLPEGKEVPLEYEKYKIHDDMKILDRILERNLNDLIVEWKIYETNRENRIKDKKCDICGEPLDIDFLFYDTPPSDEYLEYRAIYIHPKCKKYLSDKKCYWDGVPIIGEAKPDREMKDIYFCEKCYDIHGDFGS